MSQHLHDLSAGIGMVLGDLMILSHEDKITLTAEATTKLLGQLGLLQKLACAIEHELAVHRLGEAKAQGRGMVEQLALDQFNKLARDPEGNVVRPTFGGRKP